MPYIPQSRRKELAPIVIAARAFTLSSGDLNYVLARIAVEWLQDSAGSNPNYTARSILHGILQDVAAEYYRRMMAGYEDAKCAEHGDVYV